MNAPIVIVGASHAAIAAVESLRRHGYDGPLTLVGEEPWSPYQRPPLSKKYLLDELPLERLAIRPAAYYEQHGVETRWSTRVSALDVRAKHIYMRASTAPDAQLEQLAYHKLLLCTGGHARRLTCPGHDLQGVHYLRSLSDATALRAELAPGKKLAVIGAGYIGLEVAATARKLGVEVTVLEMADRCLQRVTSPVVSDFFARLHTAAGVRLRVATSVTALLGKDRVEAVQCGDEILPVDLVLVGIGVAPNVELAQAAGLDCNNGIVVDANARTSDPDVFAAGDCTLHPSVRFGGYVRLESVDNAAEQARVAASNLCGIEAQHAHVPWFWSEQYDAKLQTAGLARDYTHFVVRGDPHTHPAQFSVWYFKGDEVSAVDAINRPGDFMLGKRWIGERKRIDGERLADLSVDLKSL